MCVALWVCVFVGGFVGLWVVARGRSFLRGTLARSFSRFSGFVAVSVCGFFGFVGFCVCAFVGLCLDGFVSLWVCRFVGSGLWKKFFSLQSRAKCFEGFWVSESLSLSLSLSLQRGTQPARLRWSHLHETKYFLCESHLDYNKRLICSEKSTLYAVRTDTERKRK